MAARRPMLLLAGLTALAALLRFATLDLQSFWFDETVTVVDTLRPGFFETLRSVARMEVTPPLYFALAWPWTKIFGVGEVGLRSLSALLGTLTVPAAYAAARTVLPRPGALAVAAIAAVHPLLVWYSQEGRAYALLLLLGTLSFLFFARALERGGGRDLGWWAAASALALTTHYFAIFLVAAQAAWLAVALGRDPRARRAVLLACGAVAVVGAALVPLARHQADRGGTEWVDDVALGQRVRETGERFLTGPGDPFGSGWLGWALAAAVALLVVARFVRAPRDARLAPAARPALAVAAAAVVAPFLLAVAGVDFFHFRYLLGAWVPLVIAAAALLTPRPRLAAVTAAAVCCVSLAIVVAGTLDPSMQRTDWRAATRALGPADVPRAVVVTPFWAIEPLQAYGQWPAPMGPSGHRVREIAFIGDAGPWGLGRPPRSLGPFRLAEHHTTRFLAVTRFRATRPVRLTAAETAAILGVPPESVRVQFPQQG